jgi:RNA polymerase sigma-70 factor (sigma-E family)
VTSRRDTEFADFMLARMPSLRRLALLLCQDWHRADDLVQATLIKLYVHWARAAGADSTDAYVRGMLVREFLREQQTGWARWVRLPGQLPEAAGRLADLDVSLDLQRAVAELPPRQRAVLVLRFYCDLNVEQSAQVLACTPGTVKSQTAKGLESLRRALGHEPDASGTSRLRGPARDQRGKVSDNA